MTPRIAKKPVFFAVCWVGGRFRRGQGGGFRNHLDNRARRSIPFCCCFPHIPPPPSIFGSKDSSGKLRHSPTVCWGTRFRDKPCLFRGGTGHSPKSMGGRVAPPADFSQRTWQVRLGLFTMETHWYGTHGERTGRCRTFISDSSDSSATGIGVGYFYFILEGLKLCHNLYFIYISH